MRLTQGHPRVDTSSPGGIKYFFEPKSIAVAGASPDPTKMASIIYSKLLKNADSGVLKASVYAVNPAHSQVEGRRCYPNLGALPSPPELLVVAVPASHALGLVKDASANGAKAVVMITSGFAETGAKSLEKEFEDLVTGSGIRILGPNTVGLLDMKTGVDTLFLQPSKKRESGEEIPSLIEPLSGSVVVISQSGHLGEVITEELAANEIGIRALVGMGNQLNTSVEDIVGYFASDENTKVIAVYLEGLRDGRRFMQAASSVVPKKPIVVLKAGKTSAGAKAALTHTASLVGDYEVYKAAFRQSGVIEANDVQELVDYSVSFSLLSQRPGRRLFIVTNAGGAATLAADEAVRNGLAVEPLRRATSTVLKAKFRGTHFIANATLGNPLDLTASAPTKEFSEATAMALGSKGCDMGLILPTHQTPAFDTSIPVQIIHAIKSSRKAACVSVMGRADLAREIHLECIKNGVPSYPTPERAVKALAAYYAYSQLRSKARAPRGASPRDRFGWLTRRKGLLPPQDATRILEHYSIPQPRSLLIQSTAELGKAWALRFPAVCKLASAELPHKSDSGGVVLNVEGTKELASSFSKLKGLAAKLGVDFGGVLVQEMVAGGTELVLGSTRDQAFGPVVAFGAGGVRTEVFRDYKVAVAPVSISEARRLVAGTKVSGILRGYRGIPPVDMGKLSSLVSRFSRILAENPSLLEVEVNPLIATSRGLFAADVRMVAGPSRVLSDGDN